MPPGPDARALKAGHAQQEQISRATRLQRWHITETCRILRQHACSSGLFVTPGTRSPWHTGRVVPPRRGSQAREERGGTLLWHNGVSNADLHGPYQTEVWPCSTYRLLSIYAGL